MTSNLLIESYDEQFTRLQTIKTNCEVCHKILADAFLQKGIQPRKEIQQIAILLERMVSDSEECILTMKHESYTHGIMERVLKCMASQHEQHVTSVLGWLFMVMYFSWRCAFVILA